MSLVREFDINLTAVVDRNATAAAVAASVNGRFYEKTGSAKREEGDVFDPGIGYTLAIARALRKLAAAIEKDAEVSVLKAEAAKKEAARSRNLRHLRQVSTGRSKAPLTVSEIRVKYGRKAAERAASRRESITPADEF